MKILLNDIVQYSNAHENLKSPALSDVYNVKNGLITIMLDKWYPVNCFGFGNTDGTYFNLSFSNSTVIIDGGNASTSDYMYIYDGGNAGSEHNIKFKKNGLYTINQTIGIGDILIETDATFIGRIGAGIAVDIPTSIAKQPGWASTNKSRKTLSGNIIPGKGGYNYKTLSLDSRYKLNRDSIAELEAGFNIIGQGYPFFIDLEKESYKLPYDKLYATEKNQSQWVLEGGAKYFLYSYKFVFDEAF